MCHLFFNPKSGSCWKFRLKIKIWIGFWGILISMYKVYGRVFSLMVKHLSCNVRVPGSILVPGNLLPFHFLIYICLQLKSLTAILKVRITFKMFSVDRTFVDKNVLCLNIPSWISQDTHSAHAHNLIISLCFVSQQPLVQMRPNFLCR